jgi:hypothetical protein
VTIWHCQLTTRAARGLRRPMENRQTISKLPKEGSIEVYLDGETPWMAELLEELNEDLTDSDYEGEGNASIEFKGELVRKWNDRFNDYIILTGEIRASFYALEINSGEAILDHIEVPVRACWIQEELREKFGYEEETEIWFDEDEYDLYFYTRNNVELKPVLSEYLFLNKNPYPGLSEE